MHTHFLLTNCNDTLRLSYPSAGLVLNDLSKRTVKFLLRVKLPVSAHVNVGVAMVNVC